MKGSCVFPAVTVWSQNGCLGLQQRPFRGSNVVFRGHDDWQRPSLSFTKLVHPFRNAISRNRHAVQSRLFRVTNSTVLKLVDDEVCQSPQIFANGGPEAPETHKADATDERATLGRHVGACAQALPTQFEIDLSRGFFPMGYQPVEFTQFPVGVCRIASPTISHVALIIQLIRYQVPVCPFLFDTYTPFEVNHCEGTNQVRCAAVRTRS